MGKLEHLGCFCRFAVLRYLPAGVVRSDNLRVYLPRRPRGSGRDVRAKPCNTWVLRNAPKRCPRGRGGHPGCPERSADRKGAPMFRSVPPVHRRLSKATPQRRVLSFAIALTLLAPVLAPRPAAAGWLDDLWVGLRLLWAEESAGITPGGRPTIEPAGGATAIWAAEGWQIDPGGLAMPLPPPTDAPDRP